jgi:hypothetical protein
MNHQDSHKEKSGATVDRGQRLSTERVHVSWHDRQRRDLRAGALDETGDGPTRAAQSRVT